MTITAIILTDDIDSDNCRMVLSGVKQAGPLRVLNNFDQRAPVGTAHSLKDINGKMICTLELKDGFNPTGLTPAIGFVINEKHIEGSTTVIDRATISCVSLNNCPNSDPNIKPLL